MNTSPVNIRRALLSVSDKTGLIELAAGLAEAGVELLSTGGSARALQQAAIPVVDVSDFTGFPEMMDGRIKTLHPLVHGGILGLRDRHARTAEEHGIRWIDLVVCNLYPFETTIHQPGTKLEEAVEQIDIGGPTMIRSAAKNVGWTAAVTSPSQYAALLAELRETGGISYHSRLELCAAAFRHTAQYDALIQAYLTGEKFPDELTLTYRKFSSMRYGENPHQEAAAYRSVLPPKAWDAMSLFDAENLNGKQLSYNNMNDAWGTLETLREFAEPACVVVKHANPCGAAAGDDIVDAARRAFNADSLSAFGGIVALNRTCTREIARFFSELFIEIIMAPDFEPEALELLRKKKNLRILATGEVQPLNSIPAFKAIGDGLLVQDRDISVITEPALQLVTERVPTAAEIRDMLFGWKVLKHVKSNAILTAKDLTTLGIGPGQVSRVDAVHTALRKSAVTEGAILASDAFFPFRDSIDAIAETGIRAIIQPGGSMRDNEVIAACNEHGIAMACTGVRCFAHG